MTYEEKVQFVKELGLLCRKYDNEFGIEFMHYMSPGTKYLEEVVISWQNSDYATSTNVTGCLTPSAIAGAIFRKA